MVIEPTIVSFYPKYILSTEDLILRDALKVCHDAVSFKSLLLTIIKHIHDPAALLP